MRKQEADTDEDTMHEYLNSIQKLEFDKVKSYIQRYTLSDLGREHVEKLAPGTDLASIRANLAEVSEFKQILEFEDPPPLENIHDIRRGLHRSTIENFVLPAEELHRIALLIKTSRTINAYFTRNANQYPLLSSKVRSLYFEKVIEYNINQAIDDEGRVKDSASKELSSIRRQINERSAALKRSLESILKAIAGKDWIQEEIITTRDARMVIPVKVEHKNRVPGFIHSASASGATVFIEPTETLELNNEIRTLQFQEQREIEKILQVLTAQIREVKDRLMETVQILGEIDFVQAKARYSIACIGAEPKIVDNRSLKLAKAYHPILLQKHGRKDVVPLDLDLGGQYSTLIITGPNAGGKSVAMKTAGLLSLLALSGCHVSAAGETEIPLFTRIFVDMGDEQSIENDLSSFSSHLQNLKVILDNATEDSLVLIDEIGSGTDPAEGASLAAAILEKLTAIGAVTIVTTHQGSLKTFAFENPRIQNGAMEFDQATLRPTYRFHAGVPGSSYAIEMAERMNMPADIINRSRELKGSESNKLEDLILDLERQSQALRSDLEKVSQERGQLEQLNSDYQTKISSLEKELKTIKLQAVQEARDIVERANAIVEHSVKEIKERSAERQVIKQAKDKIQSFKEEISRATHELAPEPAHRKELRVGDFVRLRSTNTIGEISSIPDESHCMVVVGSLKVLVERKELEAVDKKRHHQAPPAPTTEMRTEGVKREIDLRGMYGEEALDAVDKFLDSAILAGLHRVDIIHGKGTGALRKKIAEHLKSNSSIKSFRLGEWNEGGTGVTVVEL